jgi:tetratricopeptide (TPR) repeat protein
MVIKTYHQILDIDPGNEQAIEALGEIFERSKRWNDLINVLEKREKLEEDPAKKVEVLKRITSIWIDSLSNFNKAVEPLERILELEPENREVMAQLKKIYEQRRSWEPLLGLLTKELEFISDDDRLEHLTSMAQIAAERLGKQEEAIDLYWQVLDLSPGDEGILLTLEKLCERKKKWPDLARVLEARVEQVEDEGARVPLLMKLGGVYGDQVDDLEKAVNTWMRLLSIQPNHPKALRILKDTYIKKRDWDSLISMFAEHENWDGLADVLNSTSESSQDPADTVLLSFKAAEVYQDRLGNTARAVKCYERVLSVEPQNREAAQALEPVYEREDNWTRMADMKSVLLETAGDDEERLELLKSLVEIRGEKLGDAQQAYALATRTYRMAPEDGDVAAALAMYGESLGEWEGLVSLYRERIPEASGDEALGLKHSVADILFRRLRNSDEALAEYKKILADEPEDGTAYDAIEEILTSTGQMDELISFYENKLESLEEPDQKVEYWQRMAKIAQEGMDDTARAAGYYAQILDADSTNTEALSELETIYRITERWEELVGIL